ncbi:MAG: DUF72 domain-containing protein, partial [Chthoniobacterales bacterium]
MTARRSTPAGRILIGTASWSDPGFVEHWYPAKLQAGERLAWYAQHFEMVEVNSTFYAIPDRRLVERWSQATPEQFVFDVKLHRLLSRHVAAANSLPPSLQHVAKADKKGKLVLTPDLESALIGAMIAAVEPLRVTNKFGAFLLQLSPSFSPRGHDLAELDGLLARLASLGMVIELRNRHWLEASQRARTLDFFREYQTSLVLV